MQGRSLISIAGCNLVGNEDAAMVYDDSVDLPLGRLYLDGELETTRGRLLPKKLAKFPIKQARAPKEIEALLPEE